MAAGLLGSVPASAVHDEGFALQGNIDHPSLIDWVDLFDVTGPASGTTTTPKASLPGDITAAAFEDDYPLPDLSGYATGSKDTLPISSGWECKTPNNLGDKFDLLNAYAAALVPSAGSEQGDLIVNFGSEISSPLGNRNAGLWLLQNDDVACEGVGNTSFAGEHVDGDVFIVSAFTNGGAQANIDVYEWVDPNPDDAVEAGSLQLKGGFTNALCPPTGQDTACAIANTDGDKQADEAQFAIDPPWTAPDKDGGNLNEAEFFEGAVNLSDLGLEGCFTRFLANSRSSQETTSTLHDFAFGDFDICDANISITGDGVNEVGEQHTFTVEAESIFGGQSSPPPDGTEVDVDLVSSPGATLDIVSNSCATDGLVGGTCTVVFTSSTPGIVTASAAADIPVGGDTVHVSTSGQNGSDPDVLKRFVDADVEIAEDAVNEVGDQHTWTVTATEDLGNGAGPQPAKTGHVDVTLDPAGGVTIDPATTCHVNGAAPHTADNLSDDGTCVVVFSSNEPTVVTGSAEVTLDYTFDEGDITVVRNTSAQNGDGPDVTKRFVDARVSITPDDVNGIGESHTFIVKVEQNIGSGWQPATNGDVSLTLTPSAGAVIEPTSNTCNQAGNDLDANGECAVTFTSQSAGTVDGAASVDVTITTPQGDIVVTRNTSAQKGAEPDVTKLFVAGSLRWIKENDQGGLLGGAIFEVCFTERFISADGSFEPIIDTDPDPDVDSRCFAVADNIGQPAYTGADTDDTAGEFQLDDLYLGTYTVQEKVAPEGYVLDDTLATVHLTTTHPNAVIDTAFVNASRYKVIVITCNTANETLVDSTVDLDPGQVGGQKETIKPGELPAGVSEATLCGLPGATYDNLERGTYNFDVELPDVEPLFP